MPAGFVVDKYIQMSLIELGFYITYWHMVKIKRKYRWIYALSFFFFVFSDYLIFQTAKMENESFYLLVHTIAMMCSSAQCIWVSEGSIWKIFAGVGISDLFGGFLHLAVASSPDGNIEKLVLSFAPQIPYIPFGIILGEGGWLLMLLAFRKYLVRFSEEPMERKLWVRLFAALYMVNTLFCITSVHSELVFTHNQSWKLGTSWCVVLAAGLVVILYCDSKRAGSQKKYYLRKQNQVLWWHYETLWEQIAVTRQFRQDVSDVLKEAGKDEDRFTEEPKEQMGGWNTGGEIIRQVLVNKRNQCKAAGIQLQIEIDEISFSDREEMDMVTLLYNLLDNAIESCMGIVDLEQRWIALVIRVKEEKIVICCKNSRWGEPVLTKGEKTRKKEKHLHGIGMEIIKAIVEKYHGEYDYKEKEQEFDIRIILPKNTFHMGGNKMGEEKEGYVANTCF